MLSGGGVGDCDHGVRRVRGQVSMCIGVRRKREDRIKRGWTQEAIQSLIGRWKFSLLFGLVISWSFLFCSQ